jgi:hypothetical protein
MSVTVNALAHNTLLESIEWDHYQFGLFAQEINDAYRVEKLDQWQFDASSGLIERPGKSCLIPMSGRIDRGQGRAGYYKPTWLVWPVIVGVPHGGLEAFAEEEEFQRELLRVKQRHKEQLARLIFPPSTSRLASLFIRYSGQEDARIQTSARERNARDAFLEGILPNPVDCMVEELSRRGGGICATSFRTTAGPSTCIQPTPGLR